MAAAHGLALRALGDVDRVMVRRWLAEPRVLRWWGTRGAAEAAVTFAAQSATAVARMILFDGTAIGYGHALDLDDPGLRPGFWQADIIVGSDRHEGRGFEAAALALLRDEVFQMTLAPGIACRVAVGRESLVRDIERAGFCWRSITREAAIGPCWVLDAAR